jgi:hypothetical protein
MLPLKPKYSLERDKNFVWYLNFCSNVLHEAKLSGVLSRVLGKFECVVYKNMLQNIAPSKP